MHNLGVYQIKHVIINDASGVPGHRLLTFDMLVLKISLGPPSFLVQMDLSRFVVGSLLLTAGLSITDNSRQDVRITP